MAKKKRIAFASQAEERRYNRLRAEREGQSKVTLAKPGQRIEVETIRGIEPMTVAEVCSSSDHGAWHCITHQERFRNTAEKIDHVQAGSHELVWICSAHGAEGPAS